MHASARELAERFIRKYVLRHKRGVVLEVGSRRNKPEDWTPREMFLEGGPWEYFGVDIRPGENVDWTVPLRGEWELPVKPMAVLSINTLEHCDRPWDVVRNAAQVLQPKGTMVLVAPFIWHLHDHPGDFYRYTGEGLAALMDYAGLTPCEWGESPWDKVVCKRDAYCAGRKRG